MRNILACPGCGNRFFKHKDFSLPPPFNVYEDSCSRCGTLVSKAIKMSAVERETIAKNYASALEAGTKKIIQTQEEHERDIKDLFG